MAWVSHILLLVAAALLLRWEHQLRYEFNDRRTSAHRKFRTRVFWLALTVLFFTEIASLYKDYEGNADKKELHGQIGELTDQNEKLHEEVNQGFKDISFEFSTNNRIEPKIRLAVLEVANDKLSAEQTSLQKTHALSNSGTVDLKELRAEREQELALRDIEKKQAAVRVEIEEVRRDKDASELAQFQHLKDQQVLKCEKTLAAQILPIFNHTIEQLNRTLADLAADSAEKRYTDFLGTTPNIYGSDLTRNEVIVDGSNFLCIGTNSAWDFRVSTATTAIHSGPIYPGIPLEFQDRDSVVFYEPYVSMAIQSQTTNGVSILTITPYRERNLDTPAYPPPERPPSADRAFYPQVLVQLKVPNHLDMRELCPFTNCNATIDKALRRLIEAQDQQCPLKLKVNN